MDTRINNLREHIRRGFSISHQKVVLEIDFAGCLWGYTEITIVPASSELRTIHLHSRQCTIHSVTVAGHSAEFTHHDPLTHISMGSSNEAQDCHRHAELKRKIYSALQDSDEGELSIAIPREVALRQSVQSSGGTIVSEAATPEPQTPSIPQASSSGTEFSPIVINITYSLRNPVDGFEFVLPTESYPYRVPHAYTAPSSPDSARCWVPCVDNIWERCTWEFEFVVPRYLEERVPTEDDDEINDLSPTIVVCSGELVEQVAHPNNSNKTIFLFSQSIPTSVQHIAFAAGPFHLYSIPPDHTADDASGIAQPLMYAFCLPGYGTVLPASTAFLRSAMSFYSTEYGSYPFGSYKVVFVDQMPSQRFDSATLSVVTNDLLFGDDAIEQALEARHALSHALACQWIGINILPKNWYDLWLTNGLALYITGLFMRKLLGNNDYRFRLKKDMMRVLEWDIGSMPPICQPQVLDPPDAAVLPFVNLKAPLVLHILDRRLCKSGISLGLSRVLPKVFLSAISGEMPNNALSTHAFLRTCRKVSGVDPRSFAEQWIYGSGCPSFGFSASFNRKKMAVEITMRQEAPAYKAMENNEVSKALLKPVDFFEGQMTIRIHEADGTPYEHVLDIRSPFKRYDVPFNTKYKRVRRNTKRYLARQAAAQAAAEGDAEAAEAMGMVDMGFGLEIWENEQERENWKVADWTEEDESIMSGATYEWIRIDADFEWIASMKFEQPDFMWVSQLQRDRDVVAQLEALYALAEKPTAIVSSTLTKTVLVSNYYFRIRCEAALALVNCAIRKLDFLGLFHLFKLFLRCCYDPEDRKQDLFDHTYVPKPNDFTDFAEYIVRKSLIHAISRVRFENGKSPAVVRKFLIDQLRYNDNTTNPYSDGFYISSIISAAASANVSTAPPERGEILPSEVRSELTDEDLDLLKQTLGEIDRYRSMDRLIPSPHNVVTIAALEFYMVLSMANLVPNHSRIYFPYTREGNYTQVRIAAFDGLFLTKWYVPQIMRYILAVMANDSSRVVRRHVAKNVCHSLALLVHMGEMRSNLKETESLLIEEDGSVPDKAKEAKKSEMDVMIKVLRKDREVGKNEVLREFLMPIALAPDVDHEVRWCILKLADILIRPVDELPPTVKIHIPVPEVPPQLQSLKLPSKVPRTIKSGGQQLKSPMVPPTVATKLRLPASPAPEPLTRAPTPLATERQRKPTLVTTSVPTATEKAQRLKGRPPKPESKVPVLKAQSGGMSLNDLRACRNALKKLKTNKHAPLFIQPVDPIRDHAPNYFDVIKDPMDLSTMGAKLEEGMYKDRFAFQVDFHLMIENAKAYNAPGSYAHNEAIALETFFEKQWSIINKTLEAADRAQPAKDILPKEPLQRRTLPPVPRPFAKPGADPTAPLPTARTDRTASVVTPTPSTSRPVIKLKVNAQQLAAGTQSEPAEGASTRKPRNPKLKADDTPFIDAIEAASLEPPPPYIDDGSHDILQEVIAIEREKKQRTIVDREREREKEKPLTNGAPGKRKKSGSTLDEDDILSLATPSKKERVSPSGSSGSSRPRLVAVASSSKPSHATQPKLKKDKQTESLGSSSKNANDVHKPSMKGKEKETPSSIQMPTTAASNQHPKSKKAPVQATPVNDKKCRDLLKVFQKIPEVAIFMRPVDPVKDGCPTYLKEIDHPMDFGTMMTKLDEGRYETMEGFRHDIELVFSNCRKFNPLGTFPVTCAEVVEKVYKKEWPKLLERKLSWAEKRGLQGVMTSLVKDPLSWIFREPVDPVALGIPTYFEIVPKKDARDLRTIRQKLDADKYETAEAFEADVELMIQNAIKFNGADSEVGIIAVQLKHRFLEFLGMWKSGNPKKRKEGEKSTTQPAKKVKVA